MLLHSMLQAAAGTANVTPVVIDLTATQWSVAAVTWDADQTWPAIQTNYRVNDVKFSPTEDRVYALDDSSKRIFTYNLARPGYLSNATINQNSLALSPIDNQPRGFCFGDNGNRLYFVGTQYQRIYQLNLGTAYDPASGSIANVYDFTNNNVRPRDPQKIIFSANGRKMWVFFRSIQLITNRTQGFLQYNLGTAWDVSTASWEGINFYPRINLYYVALNSRTSGTGQYAYPNGLSVMGDQVRMYVISGSGSRPIVALSLSSQGQMATAQASSALNTSGQDWGSTSLFVNPDQSRAYMIGANNRRIYQYTISTPGNLSTASYQGRNMNIGLTSSYGEDQPRALTFSPDGTRMYFYGTGQRRIWQCQLNTAWDISTAKFAGADGWFSAYIGGYENSSESLRFSPDGNKFFVLGTASTGGAPGTTCISEFTVPSPWTLFDAQLTGRISVNAQNYSASGMYFRPDGLQLFIVGTSNSNVAVFNLGSAWTINTASHAYNWLVPPGPGQNSNNCGPFDNVRVRASLGGTIYGSNPYRSDSSLGKAVVHAGIAAVGEYVWVERYNPGRWSYTGSSANGVTSLSSGTSCGFAIRWAEGEFKYSRETAPRGIYFSPWGDRMYIVGSGYIRIHQYNLSTPWNLNTASYAGFASILYYGRDLWFSDDGMRFIIINSGRIYIHELAEAWEIKTINSRWTYIFRNVNPTDVGLYTEGIDFSPDGRYMFVLNNSKRNVVRLEMAQNWNINTMFLPSSNINGTLSLPSTVLPIGMAFSRDGRNLYMVGHTTSGAENTTSTIFHYTLAQEWEIRTATLVTQVARSTFNVSQPLSHQITSKFTGIGISDDGSVLYLTTYDPVFVLRVRLTTPFSITGLLSPNPHAGPGYYVPVPTTYTNDFFFKSDFTRLYTFDTSDYASVSAGRLFSYDMSRYQQIDTAVNTITPKQYDRPVHSMGVNQGGTVLLTGQTSRILRYKIATAWTPETGGFENGVTLNSTYMLRGRGFYWHSSGLSGRYKMAPDARNFFTINGRTLYKLNFPGDYDFNSTPTITNNILPSFSTGWTPGGFAYSYDGMTLYVMKDYGGTPYNIHVVEYRLSSPWGMTFTYVRRTQVFTSGFGGASSVFVRPDGGALFFIHNRRIKEYRMAIPFNSGTITYQKELSLDTGKGGNDPMDLVWSSDGYKLIVLSNYPSTIATDPGPAVHEYRCTVPFDLATATWIKTFDLYNRSHGYRVMRSIDVSQDGRRMIIGTYNPTYIFSYTLKAD